MDIRSKSYVKPYSYQIGLSQLVFFLESLQRYNYFKSLEALTQEDREECTLYVLIHDKLDPSCFHNMAIDSSVRNETDNYFATSFARKRT